MPFMIEEGFLPASLTAPPMTDEEFAAFCSKHPDYFFETTAEGQIIVMPPNYSLAGIRNLKICAQLESWANLDGSGIVSDSSTGFVLPNGARRSPDAAWIAKSRIRQLDTKSLNRYWPLCPDFVIELRSPTDRLPVLREKMLEWIANGSQLAWLIDPERRAVETYRPGQETVSAVDVESVDGEGPVAGFTLDLRPVWDPLGFSIG